MMPYNGFVVLFLQNFVQTRIRAYSFQIVNVLPYRFRVSFQES